MVVPNHDGVSDCRDLGGRLPSETLERLKRDALARVAAPPYAGVRPLADHKLHRVSPTGSKPFEAVPGRRGDFLKTISQRRFWPLSPEPDDFDIEDIAAALSNLCRYNGHLHLFYSVAEHSILVSRLVKPELALCGLLHDATEAYLSDLARPVKHMPEFLAFRQVEQLLEAPLARKFGLPFPFPPEVKEADNVALAIEVLQLRDGAHDPDWERWRLDDLPDVRLLCLPSGASRQPFLDRFHELTYQ